MVPEHCDDEAGGEDDEDMPGRFRSLDRQRLPIRLGTGKVIAKMEINILTIFECH